MKKILLLQVFLVTFLIASGVKARPGLRTVEQPDGSVVKVRLAGDEFHHTFFSEEGYPLVKNEGFYYYAVVDSEGKLTPSSYRLDNPVSTPGLKAFLSSNSPQETAALLTSARSKAVSSKNGRLQSTRSIESKPPHFGLFEDSSFPTKGSPKVLVILTEFADKRMTLDDPYDYFSRLLNEQGFSDYGGTGSVSDYFLDSSSGEFSPQFDLYGPVTLSQNMAYYGENDKDGNDKRPVDMIVEACQALDADVDFSDYDCDGDGYIDNVFVFYAGEGEAVSGEDDTIWPHSWYVSAGRPGRVYLDGVILDKYACSNEWVVYGNSAYPDGVGTFIHEFSHVLGLPDLYSTVYSSSYTPEEWSVLDVGSYNNNGCTPPAYSAFERYALGWIEPVELTKSGPMTLRSIANNEAGIIPTFDSDGNRTPKEIFIVENRQKTGWDRYLPSHGMLVWHIDYDEDVWWNNEVNNNASHQYVDLVEAAGELLSKRGRVHDPFPGFKKVTEFSETTTPGSISWKGVPCGISLIGIEEKAGLVNFTVESSRGDGDDPGSVDTVNGGTGSISWICHGSTLMLENLQPDCEITITDITGKTVATQVADFDGKAVMTLPASGIYILVSGAQILKIKI